MTEANVVRRSVLLRIFKSTALNELVERTTGYIDTGCLEEAVELDKLVRMHRPDEHEVFSDRVWGTLGPVVQED